MFVCCVYWFVLYSYYIPIHYISRFSQGSNILKSILSSSIFSPKFLFSVADHVLCDICTLCLDNSSSSMHNTMEINSLILLISFSQITQPRDTSANYSVSKNSIIKGKITAFYMEGFFAGLGENDTPQL